MTERQKMLSGELYRAEGEELAADRRRCLELTRRLNSLALFDDAAEREKVVRQLFRNCGKGCNVTPPFFCDYGCNISVGDNFYANFDCVILDVAEVEIGDNVLLGPRVCIFTAGHPLDAGTRRGGLEFGRKVRIGSDVWLGGNVTVNPGVTIGCNVVVGSGSVVTRDIPDNVVAVGNPARVIRRLAPVGGGEGD